MTRVLVSVFVLFGVFAWSLEAGAGCEKDTDCKGERVCVNEECVQPSAPVATPAPIACAKDVDCPDELVCINQVCAERGSAPPLSGAVEPTPTPSPTPNPTVTVSVATGTIKITSETPGEVLIDGGVIGRTPLEQSGLPPGDHELRVNFDSGGNRKQRIMILAGQTIDVHVAPSRAREAFAYRDGLNFGIYAGGSGFFIEKPKHPGGGARLGLAANYGIIPGIDFRTGIDLVVGGWSNSFALFAGLPAKLHFNLGSVYTIMIGGYVGLHSVELEDELMTDPSCFDEDNSRCYETVALRETSFWFGPTASLLTFRFGEKRQFEVFVDGTVPIGIFPGQTGNMPNALEAEMMAFNARIDIGFTWLFLPDG